MKEILIKILHQEVYVGKMPVNKKAGQCRLFSMGF